MIISSLYRKSVYHANHNEDQLLIETNLHGRCILAVMDGCSTAIDSEWASGLMMKILKGEIKRLQLNGATDISNKTLSETLFKVVFEKIKKIKDDLGLETIELFSTLLLTVIDPSDRSFHLSISGDGFYMVDEQHHSIDANNTPDFMGYHLDKSFDDFFSNHVNHINGSIKKRFLLATDGIEKLNDMKRSKTNDWILKNGLPSVLESNLQKNSLEKKYEQLRKRDKLYPLDDVSVIALEF